MISPLLPPAFSPPCLQPVPSTAACTSKSPADRSQITHGQNFIRTVLLGAKLLAHSFLLTTSYVVLLIIKAQFLGTSSYPSCFTTLSMSQTIGTFLFVCPFPPIILPGAVSLVSLFFKGYYRRTDVTNKGYLPNSSKFSLHLGSTCNVKISSPFFGKCYV